MPQCNVLKIHFSRENYFILKRHNESWKHDYNFEDEIRNILHACIHQPDAQVMKKNISGKKQQPLGRKQHPNYSLLPPRVAKAQKMQKTQLSG